MISKYPIEEYDFPASKKHPQKDFLASILEIESQFINDLRRIGALADKYRCGNLEERHIQTLSKIYSENRPLAEWEESKEFLERMKAFEREESEKIFGEFERLYRKTFEGILRDQPAQGEN